MKNIKLNFLFKIPLKMNKIKIHLISLLILMLNQ